MRKTVTQFKLERWYSILSSNPSWLTSNLHDELIASAQTQFPNEVFGFLLEDGKGVRYERLSVVSGACWFFGQPETAIAFAYRMKEENLHVRGTFHSHPEGDLFSEMDKGLAQWASLHMLAVRLHNGSWTLVCAQNDPANLIL